MQITLSPTDTLTPDLNHELRLFFAFFSLSTVRKYCSSYCNNVCISLEQLYSLRKCLRARGHNIRLAGLLKTVFFFS